MEFKQKRIPSSEVGLERHMRVAELDLSVERSSVSKQEGEKSSAVKAEFSTLPTILSLAC